MDQLEKEVEAMLRKRVNNMGGLFYKFVSPGNNGVPDRIAVLPGGRIWFIELKNDTGKPAKLQEWVIKQLRMRGANAIVISGKKEALAWCEARLRDADGLEQVAGVEGGGAL